MKKQKHNKQHIKKMNQDTDEILLLLREQFLEQDYGGLMLHALSYLIVLTLLRKQVVSKHFKELCSKTIRNKCGENGPPPLTNETLREAVRKYCRFMDMYRYPFGNKDDMETIACTYGFPIDSWNVSQVTDMSELFRERPDFDRYIGSWNTSNVTNMYRMFYHARTFNQDIGRWDVSNVTSMSEMFYWAYRFNRDIGQWTFPMLQI
ncbi:lipoprotein [Nitzschia inconspicua]|uniref:Lipoprotein n=1 Tax=Nitzschia inconspicua TaxID=303405 RepID=A0A9K3LA57_9STRA|nr:lipoprotein [Nitzschia inconspicua]